MQGGRVDSATLHNGVILRRIPREECTAAHCLFLEKGRVMAVEQAVVLLSHFFVCLPNPTHRGVEL